MTKDETMVLLVFSLTINIAALLIAKGLSGWTPVSLILVVAVVVPLDAWLKKRRLNSN